MIQLNATVHTIGGVTIATGSVLDVTPHFVTRRVDTGGVISVEYDISFDADIYKSLASYEANDPILISAELVEFSIGYTAFNQDALNLASVTELLNIYKKYIENGDAQYSGIGVGKAAIVYPFQ